MGGGGGGEGNSKANPVYSGGCSSLKLILQSALVSLCNNTNLLDSLELRVVEKSAE